MSQDWPSQPESQPVSRPLPTIDDLPIAWEGYDRAQVEAAFDAFYRHIAQLDATLRTLESVEVFRDEAGSLRADLRAIRAAGWSPYPRGYTLAPERSLLGDVPEALPRLLLEVVFLVAVAAVAAAAKLSGKEIVIVMAGAVVLTALVELVAARERRSARKLPFPEESEPEPAAPAPAPAPRAAAAAVAQPPEDGAGWAAFAEPSSAKEADLLDALTDGDEPAPGQVEGRVDEPTEETEPPEAAAEPDPESEPDPATPEAPVAAAAAPPPEPEATRRSRFLRRRREQPPQPAPGREPQPVPAVSAADGAPAEDTLDPWERGFDQTDEIRPSRD
jgi:hypothetical protein